MTRAFGWTRPDSSFPGESGRVGRPLLVLLVGALGLAAGLAPVLGPFGILAVLGALSVVAIVLMSTRMISVFHIGLAVVLAGYAFLDRGFAYIGVGGLFVGELVAALAVVAILFSLPRWRLGIVEGAILVFMAWGLARTVPYIGPHGIDALRDAVAWGYGVIALAVGATVGSRTVAAAVGLYRRVALPLVMWLPLAAVVTIVAGDVIPSAPGSDVPIIYFKAGDAGVHLAGIAAFVLTGLYGGRAVSLVRSAILWTAWLVALGLVAAINRGGMVAASTASLSLLFVRRANQWIVALSVATVLLIGAWVADPEIDLGIDRRVSFSQLVDNVTSIFIEGSDTQTQATKNWRIEWWDTIVGYTLGGQYLWEGKGYGVNLADSDGFQVEVDGSLRSPHSAHFEILARSGLPGLISWVLMQAAIGVTLLRAGRRAAALGRSWWVAVTAWLAVYWLAMLVNMSVDVYLAGPMGGIWFWAVVGGAIAVGRLTNELEPAGNPDEPGPRSG